MLFIEVFAPQGALGAERRALLAKRLVELDDGVNRGEYHPESVEQNSRAYTQVVVHEPLTWVAGEHTVDADWPRRYAVRVRIPSPWVKEVAGEFVERYNRIVATTVRDVLGAGDEPQVWVEVHGVREGTLGLDGRVMGAEAISQLFTGTWRESVAGRGPVAGPEPGTVHCPVCSMVVTLDDSAITLEYAGDVYGYCSKHCRRAHAEELGVAVPA
ncbi:hypothetical protein [Streptomonospora wellingtoniae]|uniref:TRASH domain-containing protein n=1 Tax=Streptomonospora wellingtoniae TaxID=3075544 RepID=A0ABU2KR84_9ACTN|nr:hypothetical protein [Streptomonospora sp. DSM 45055]MDT0301791.1 hypothetical protein [Streptomonospora sp. DSM 45055]